MAIANVLSIAGSDPSGGAGIQADLKTFAAHRTYGMAAITALTAQNTQGVSGIHAVPPGFVADQIRAVARDIRIDAIKIGMIASADIAEAVADALPPGVPVVLDPVMRAKGGAALLPPEAAGVLARRLVPRALVLTPNLPEAAALLQAETAAGRAAMAAQGQALRALGPVWVLVKGGHLPGDDSPDLLAGPDGAHWLEARRTPTRNTHGTGCTLSSAIAARLARGAEIRPAVEGAKAWLSAAIAAADGLSVGHGHGPVDHGCAQG